MKLIIDISDKTYEIIRDMMYFYNPQRNGRAETKEIITAIKQGIPLPKGHGRLIDADAYIDKHEECGWLDDILVNDFNIITPTIIEADKGENEK